MIKRILIVILLSMFITTAARAAVKLKIAVVNPSHTEEQTTPVRFDLPKGIGPECIIDTGEMKLGYDFDNAAYYVYQTVTLKPSEKIILEVELRDIWTIPGKEIGFLENHTEILIKKLKATRHSRVGTTLSKKIKGRLEEISKRQKEVALSTKERINFYYEDIGILNRIKEDIGILENLVIDVGGIVEERVEVPATLAVSVAEEGVRPEEILELKVRVSNPLKKSGQVAAVKYGLPEEVVPGHILDSGGLEMGYDFDKECFYVYKDEVALEPAETKVFVIKIKDIWRIPEVEIEALRAHTNNMMLLLEGTEYSGQGKPIADRVFFNLDGIVKSQSMKVAPDEHMAYYRGNISTLDETKKYVAQLEKIVSQSGASPGVTIARAERLKGGGPEVKRPRGYEGIAFIAKSIFRGRAPTVATTWKIIFIILGFIGIVAGLFFVLWYVQVKRREKK